MILLVEDNALLRKALGEVLRTAFPELPIEEASTGEEAIRKFDVMNPEIIFLDIKLPDTSGLKLAKHMRGSSPESQIFILTAYDVADYRAEAWASGVNDFLVKGVVSASEIIGIVGSIADNGNHRALAASVTPTLR